MLLAKHSTYFVSFRSCFTNCRVSISASGTTAGPLQRGNSTVGSCHKATKASHLTQHHPPTHNPPHPTNHPFQQRAQGRPCRGWGKNGEEIRRTRKGSGGSRRRGGERFTPWRGEPGGYGERCAAGMRGAPLRPAEDDEEKSGLGGGRGRRRPSEPGWAQPPARRSPTLRGRSLRVRGPLP